MDGEDHLVRVADAHHPSGGATRPAGDVGGPREGLQHVFVFDLGPVHVPDDDVVGFDHGVDVHPHSDGPVPAEDEVCRPLAVLDDPVWEVLGHDEDVSHGEQGLQQLRAA